MRTSYLFLLAVAVLMAVVDSASASIAYSTSGSTYSQRFDTLPNTPENVSLGATPIGWINDTATPGANQFSIVGWHLFHPLTQSEGGANGNQRMRIGAGTATTGAFMSFGTSGSAERALGMVSSGTMSATNAESYYGARITNNTGTTLVEFTLSYTGEQWRNGGFSSPNTASLQQGITFDYSLNAATIQDGAATFTDVPALNFAGPVFGTAAAGALNGNTASNRVLIGPTTVTGLNWAPGADLWIRWADINNPDNDHGLAIDDLSFSAVAIPEPAAVLFGGLVCGLVGLAIGGRRLINKWLARNSA